MVADESGEWTVFSLTGASFFLLVETHSFGARKRTGNLSVHANEEKSAVRFQLERAVGFRAR